MTLFTKILIAAPLALLSFAGDSQAQFGRGRGWGGGGYGYGGGGYGYGGSGINYGTRVGNNGFLSIGTGFNNGYGYGGSGISYGTRVGNNGFLSVGTGFNNGYGYGSPYGYGNSYGSPYYGNSYYSGGVVTSPSYAPATTYYTPSGTVVTGNTLRAMPATDGVIQAGATSPAGTVGKYTVVVPENAKVWFNGAKNDQKGARRDFTSTGSGQLTIKVEWKQGDQQMSKELMVNVQDGEQSTVDLTPLLN